MIELIKRTAQGTHSLGFFCFHIPHFLCRKDEIRWGLFIRDIFYKVQLPRLTVVSRLRPLLRKAKESPVQE